MRGKNMSALQPSDKVYPNDELPHSAPVKNNFTDKDSSGLKSEQNTTLQRPTPDKSSGTHKRLTYERAVKLEQKMGAT